MSVRNISLRMYYRNEAAKRNSVYEIAMQDLEDCLSAPNTVEAEIEAGELAGIIGSFLENLTVENRVIFMRRYAYMDTETVLNGKGSMCMNKKIFAEAVTALCILFIPFGGGVVVTAYAHGTGEEIPAAGAVMSSGTISDGGEMTGHPLMFYLSGKDIVSVRFSCKNQQICFMDRTEKRDEYGNAKNFTVTYGEDEREYDYLTIDWVPNRIIRELTDNADSTIAILPD